MVNGNEAGVSADGYFGIMVDLTEGENVIIVRTSKEGIEDSKKTVSVIRENKNVNVKKEKTRKEVVQEYFDDTGPILDTITEANKLIVECGNEGALTHFSVAEELAIQAKEKFEEAKNDFNSLSTPTEMEKNKELIVKTLDKYIEASDYYIEGCRQLDANTILIGIDIYEEGTSFLNLAIDETINVKAELGI